MSDLASGGDRGASARRLHRKAVSDTVLIQDFRPLLAFDPSFAAGQQQIPFAQQQQSNFLSSLEPLGLLGVEPELRSFKPRAGGSTHERRSSAGSGSSSPPRPSRIRTGFSTKKLPMEKPADAFATQTRANALDPKQLDPKRARRIIANRQSAHKSRMKKLEHVQALEKEVEEAQALADSLRLEAANLEASNAELLVTTESARRQAAHLQQQLQRHAHINQALQAEFAHLSAMLKERQQQQQQQVQQAGVAAPTTSPATGLAQMNESHQPGVWQLQEQAQQQMLRLRLIQHAHNIQEPGAKPLEQQEHEQEQQQQQQQQQQHRQQHPGGGSGSTPYLIPGAGGSAMLPPINEVTSEAASMSMRSNNLLSQAASYESLPRALSCGVPDDDATMRTISSTPLDDSMPQQDMLLAASLIDSLPGQQEMLAASLMMDSSLPGCQRADETLGASPPLLGGDGGPDALKPGAVAGAGSVVGGSGCSQQLQWQLPLAQQADMLGSTALMLDSPPSLDAMMRASPLVLGRMSSGLPDASTSAGTGPGTQYLPSPQPPYRLPPALSMPGSAASGLPGGAGSAAAFPGASGRGSLPVSSLQNQLAAMGEQQQQRGSDAFGGYGAAPSGAAAATTAVGAGPDLSPRSLSGAAGGAAAGLPAVAGALTGVSRIVLPTAGSQQWGSGVDRYAPPPVA